MNDTAMNKNAPKKRIVLVTKDDLFADVAAVFLEGCFDAAVEVADTSRAVEKLLEGGALPGLALVIVEDERILQAGGATVGSFMAPAIVIGKEPSAAPAVSGRKVRYVSRPVNMEHLASAVQSFSQTRAPREYCPVRASTLVLFRRELTHDIYRRDANGGYALAFRRGEALADSGHAASELFKGGSFYIRFTDFTDFLKAFASDLQALAAGREGVFDLGDSIQLTASVHEMVANGFPELGFTPELQAAVKVSIDSALETIRREPKLAEILRDLEKNDAEYLSWHSVGLCYVACRISSLMTWDSPNTHHKLSLAAFLHDITLLDSQYQRMNTLKELTVAGASREEIEQFREHPFAAAALAREMRGFPGDVDHIIAEHHELPNGTGFPMGMNHSRISPLAAVFIVSHELTDELFDRRAGFRFRDAIERLEAVYNQGYFRRVLSALKSAVAKDEIAL